jgi:hypothetical protein
MASVLVSGVASHVAEVATALRERGADVTEVTALADMQRVCAEVPPRSFDAYVQLAANFQANGDTAIRRVHHFYANGVLARFAALDAALPALAPDARVVFVLGVLPPEVTTEYDREARRALTRVLGHAARADVPDGRLTTRVLESGAPPDEISQVALGIDPARQELMAKLDELSYADWRVELLGLAMVET